MVIEDSTNGIKAAKAAGMKCIAIRNMHAVEKDLKEAEPDMMINSMNEVTENVLKDLP